MHKTLAGSNKWEPVLIWDGSPINFNATYLFSFFLIICCFQILFIKYLVTASYASTYVKFIGVLCNVAMHAYHAFTSVSACAT